MGAVSSHTLSKKSISCNSRISVEFKYCLKFKELSFKGATFVFVTYFEPLSAAVGSIWKQQSAEWQRPVARNRGQSSMIFNSGRTVTVELIKVSGRQISVNTHVFRPRFCFIILLSTHDRHSAILSPTEMEKWKWEGKIRVGGDKFIKIHWKAVATAFLDICLWLILHIISTRDALIYRLNIRKGQYEHDWLISMYRHIKPY